MQYESHAGTLNAISDDKSLLVFKTIALTSPDSNSLRRKSKLTRKQYYTRTSRLIRAGLIKKSSGKYFLTAYGKIIYDAQKISDDERSLKERRKIIDTLIDDKEIKESLLAKSMR